MGMTTFFECLQKDEVDLFVVVCGNNTQMLAANIAF